MKRSDEIIQRRRSALLAFSLAAATTIVFWPAMHVGFLYLDDNLNVTANPFIQQGFGLRSLAWAFTTFRSELWNPVLWLSYMLDFRLFGLDQAGFHLTSLLLHAANGVLLFWVLKKMTGRAWESAFAAALFALHPLCVEPVAWITERKELLYAFFLLLSLAAYASYVRKKSALHLTTVYLAFALALMSKGLAVMFPFVLLLLDFWPLERLKRSNVSSVLIEKIPLLALSAIAGALDLAARRSIVASDAAAPIARRVADACWIYVHYLWKIFWPAGLPIVYPRTPALAPLVFMSYAGVLIGISWAAWRVRKELPFVLVGWAWFFLSLLPVSGLLGGGLGNRYAYFPHIGIAIALAWTGAWAVRRFRAPYAAAWAASLGILFASVAGTRAELAYWSDQKLLYERALLSSPDNELFHNFYGVYLADHGDLPSAEAQFREAIRISPEYADSHNNLGFLLEREGRIPEAIYEYRRTLELLPSHPQASRNLSRVLQASKRMNRKDTESNGM